MNLPQLLFRCRYAVDFAIKAKTNLYVHSPAAFQFYNQVLLNKKGDQTLIRGRRQYEQHLRNAGNKIFQRISLPHRYGRLLFNMVEQYQPNNICEMGTGLGLSSWYMRMAKPSHLLTVDRDEERQQIAAKIHQKLALAGSIEWRNQDIFSVAQEKKPFDFYFVDAGHERSSLIPLMDLILSQNPLPQWIVLDDINWSADMFSAWEELRKREQVRMSIRLFRMGILNFDPAIHRKYDFCFWH